MAVSGKGKVWRRAAVRALRLEVGAVRDANGRLAAALNVARARLLAEQVELGKQCRAAKAADAEVLKLRAELGGANATIDALRGQIDGLLIRARDEVETLRADAERLSLQARANRAEGERRARRWKELARSLRHELSDAAPCRTIKQPHWQRVRSRLDWGGEGEATAELAAWPEERPTLDDSPQAAAKAQADAEVARLRAERDCTCRSGLVSCLRCSEADRVAWSMAFSAALNSRPEHRLSVQEAKHSAGAVPVAIAGERNMSDCRDVNSGVRGGAEGRTLSASTRTQPETAARERFAETPCQNMAKADPHPEGGLNDFRAPDVQCHENGTAVQCPHGKPTRDACDVCSCNWPPRSEPWTPEQWASALRDQAPRPVSPLPSFGALVAARWAEVWGSFDAVWALALELAALCRLGPGMLRRLDEFWTLGVGHEHDAPLWRTSAFGFSLFGPDGRALAWCNPTSLHLAELPGDVPTVPDELECLLRAAIDEARAIRAELEVLDTVAERLRGEVPSWAFGPEFTGLLAHEWWLLRKTQTPPALWSVLWLAVGTGTELTKPVLARAELRAWLRHRRPSRDELLAVVERARIIVDRELREGVRHG